MQCCKDIEELKENYKEILNEANIFYSQGYAKLIKDFGNRCLYVYDDRGVIVVVICRKYFFRWGQFPSEPFYFVENVDEREFLDDVMALLRDRIQWLIQTQATANFRDFPTHSTRIPFGNYMVDLTQDESELFKNVTGKCRNMIRRAKKDGVTIIHGGIELLNDYNQIDIDTWARSGIKKNSGNVLEKYLSILGKNAQIYLALKDKKIQGGAVFIMNKAMSYYLYGASIDKPSIGAMNLLQWQAMLDFKSKGVIKHNFVGCRINVDQESKFYNIQFFKKSFGGDLVEGYMFKVVNCSYLYQLFQWIYKIKRGSEYQPMDIIDQELHKWYDLNE